jgi:hypothetical protein
VPGKRLSGFVLLDSFMVLSFYSIKCSDGVEMVV